jgi:hypothetical protein
MLRPTRCLLVLFLFACLGAWRPSPAAAQAGSVVTCESRGSSREQCRIPADVRVELTKHLSDTPCEQGRNWGVSSGYIWVSNGCRAEFTVTSAGYGGGGGGNPGYGNANVNPNQLRACQTEADRRMSAYSYNQISVTGESRQGPIAYVRWRAGPATGLCSVHANGRVLSFTTDNGPGGGGNPGVTTQITCESQRTDREQCTIPAGARVRLLKQLSTNACRLNDTYGQGPDYIWVSQGCRGQFEVVVAGSGGNVGNPGTTMVTCSAGAASRRQCPIPSGAQVRLVRQLSNAQCRQNQTWGTGQNFIWVTQGCSAQFQVAGGGGGWQGGNTGVQRMVCQSATGGRQQCPVPGAYAVRIVKQNSTNPCQLNESFGVGTDYIWVSNGCRGEFEVTVGGAISQPTYPSGGTGLPQRVTCESSNGQRNECRIRNGAQVQLVKQLSNAACVRNQTWGTGDGILWVIKGCRGEFEVR